MILGEATIKQLTDRKAELTRQTDAIDAELARRHREWAAEQQRQRSEWLKNNSDRGSMLRALAA